MAVIYGTSEADVMSGSEGNDELFGLESDDQIWGTAGADLLDGGEGFDSVDYRIMSSGVSVDIRQGLASVTKADGSIDTLVAIEKVVGSFLDDTLASSVSGVTLEGSGGDDVYIIGSEGVTIIEDERGGYDELRTSVNIQKMDPFLDKMTFTGTGDFKGYGNAEHNVIIAAPVMTGCGVVTVATGLLAVKDSIPSATPTALKASVSSSRACGAPLVLHSAIPTRASRPCRVRISTM